MADGVGDACRPAVGAGSSDSLRQHRQEEVGRQFGLHGPLRLRRRLALLGHLGLQHVLRRQTPPLLGQGQARPRPEVPHPAGHPSRLHPLPQRRHGGDVDGAAVLPDGVDGVLPVRVRGDHSDTTCRIVAGADEHPGLDGLRAAVAHLLLHRRRLLLVGRRLPLPVGRNRLLRRLRHPPLLRHRRIHRCVLGGTAIDEGSGAVPAEQRAADADGGGAAVDGVGGVQRRGPVRCQHRLVAGGAQHQHLRRHVAPRLDLPRRRLLPQALRHRRRPGHDHRPRLHHPRRRAGARMGGNRDGRAVGQHSVVHDDGGAQAQPSAAAGGRHARRLPHARRGRLPRRCNHGPLRGAGALQPLPPRHQLPRRLLRRRRRRAVPQAGRGRAVRRRLERRRHHRHLPRHPPRPPAPHARGRAHHRRRRRARRGGLRPLGRRREVRLHPPRVVRRHHAAPPPPPPHHQRQQSRHQHRAQRCHTQRLTTCMHVRRNVNNEPNTSEGSARGSFKYRAEKF